MIRLDRPHRVLPSSFAVVMLAVLSLVVAACAPGSGSLGSPATPPPSNEPSIEIPSSDATPPVSPSPVPSPTVAPSGSPDASAGPTASPPAPTATPAGTTIIRAYFFLGSFTDNAGLAPVLREVPETKAVATAAMRNLLAGPNEKELSARPAMYTAIPDATQLLDLTIDKGVATVDLSSEFKGATASFEGGQARAQVVYTLTQFSTVDAVRILVAGEASGGQLTRADYQLEGLLPAIFVDRPAWGAALGNPGIVSGLANVFEATFRVQLRDAKDGIIADRQVMASCGTGCWGTFKVRVEYTVAKAQWGTLRVFNLSAKDGTPEHVTEYPVWLTPAT